MDSADTLGKDLRGFKNVMKKVVNRVRKKDKDESQSRSQVHGSFFDGATKPLRLPKWRFRSPISRSKTESRQQTLLNEHTQALAHERAESIILKTDKTANDETLKLLNEYKNAVARFQKDNLRLQAQAVGLESKIKNLEGDLRVKAPLFDVGVAVRIRVLEKYKSGTDSANPEDTEAVKIGNNAAHNGNLVADAALFRLQLVNVDRHAGSFERIYRMGAPNTIQNLNLSNRVIETINCRGTVELSIVPDFPNNDLLDEYNTKDQIVRDFFRIEAGVSPLAEDIEAKNVPSAIKKARNTMENLAVAIQNKALQGKRNNSIPQDARDYERKLKKQQKKIAIETQSKATIIVGEDSKNVEVAVVENTAVKGDIVDKVAVEGIAVGVIAIEEQPKQKKKKKKVEGVVQAVSGMGITMESVAVDGAIVEGHPKKKKKKGKKKRPTDGVFGTDSAITAVTELQNVDTTGKAAKESEDIFQMEPSRHEAGCSQLTRVAEILLGVGVVEVLSSLFTYE